MKNNVVKKMLSDWKAPYIQSLNKLIETQSKATLAIWAVDYSERVILPLWRKYYPDDLRPQNALNAAREWLSGTIKLPQAEPVILECHAAAREADGTPVAQAAARTIGQCASTIHSAKHCIGLAFYGALALAYDRLGTDAPLTSLSGSASRQLTTNCVIAGMSGGCQGDGVVDTLKRDEQGASLIFILNGKDRLVVKSRNIVLIIFVKRT